MAQFKVLLTDYAWKGLEPEQTALAAADAELIVAKQGTPEELAALAPLADAIMTNWARVSAEVINAAGNCRIISRLGIGLDNIDVEAATRRGIVVTNIPDYCLIEVAEHALALLLALARKTAFYHWQTKNNVYDLQAGPELRRIEGQTLGIIGFGHIGRLLAIKAQGLGLRVIVYSRTKKPLPAGMEWREMNSLLEESDFVSLNCPGTPQTRHMISTAQLALMKPTAYLINTSRGVVLDEAALASALAENRIAGAGLDVQEHEPPDLSLPLFNDPRVIVTPHAAFVSRESLENLRRRVVGQVIARLQGKTPENVINPQAMGG